MALSEARFLQVSAILEVPAVIGAVNPSGAPQKPRLQPAGRTSMAAEQAADGGVKLAAEYDISACTI